MSSRYQDNSDDSRTQRYETGYSPDRGSGRSGDAYRSASYNQSGYNQSRYDNQSGGYQQSGYRGDSGSGGNNRTPQVNYGYYAGGVIATAVVTALGAWLAAWIIRVVFERLTDSGRFGVWNPMAQDEYWFALVGFVCALLGGLLWVLLTLTTPSPNQFYTWIVGLLIAAAIIIPLALSEDWRTGLATAIEHAVIGFPVLYLIKAVGAKCTQWPQGR